MGQSFPPGQIAVYIHIPYCLSRCGYCSFYSVPYRRDELDSYVGALEREASLFMEHYGCGKVRAKTLYFGGGTPSLLEAEQINRLAGMFELDAHAEVTLEVNPIQITPSYLRELAKTPVNRLSIGLQSSRDEDLEWLQRRHRFAGFADKLQLCRDHGFANISLDLIYGLPGSDEDGLLRVLEDYIALEPQHISCYLLSLDEDCGFAREGGEGILSILPDDDAGAGQYECLRGMLVSAGYGHYEISNFALEGYESRHNLCYWHSEPYLALGASASGWLPPLRYTNPADVDAYMQMLDMADIMPDAKQCDAGQREQDYVMMRLRLLEGIDLAEFEARFGKPFALGREKAVELMQEIGMLHVDHTRLCLTPQALFVSNAVIGELL